MKKLNLDKNKTYLLACSFGPDSMALLDKLLKENYKIVVCHVNYHKRDISNFEEESLRKYCLEHGTIFEVLDTTSLSVKGNFQAWARTIRYEFFKECYQKYNANGLFVAHQQDDAIETYILQKRRNNYVNYFGMQEESSFLGMKIIRPLLDETKKELEQYNKINNVPYSIDISNLSNNYQRNIIRHTIIEKLDKLQRNEYLKAIKKDNDNLSKIKCGSAKLVHNNHLLVKEAKLVNKDIFAYALFILLANNDIHSLSKKRIDSFISMFDSKKANIKIKLNSEVNYYQEYGKIYVLKNPKLYRYLLTKPGEYTFNEFSINLTYCKASIDEYPLTIRPMEKGDYYLIKEYRCLVSRLFIDWKMPLHLRKSWPLIVNKFNEVIYIPRYRENFVQKNDSLFKIYLDSLK